MNVFVVVFALESGARDLSLSAAVAEERKDFSVQSQKRMYGESSECMDDGSVD